MLNPAWDMTIEDSFKAFLQILQEQHQLHGTDAVYNFLSCAIKNQSISKPNMVATHHRTVQLLELCGIDTD